MTEAYIEMTCTPATFRRKQLHPVRWLDWDSDFALTQEIWPDGTPLTIEVWAEAEEAGYRCCGVIEEGVLVAVAAVWRYSQRAWEVAAVATSPGHRRRGYGQAVVTFATDHILRHGREATIHTSAINHAMRRTAASLGFMEAVRRTRIHLGTEDAVLGGDGPR